MRSSTCSPSFIRPCRGMPWSGASPASRSSRSNPTIWLSLKNSRSTSSISGRIDPPGERDVFGIALKKGEKHIFSLESRTFGLPLDAVLQVLDADRQDPGRDRRRRRITRSRARVHAPADGKYRVVVRDLNGRGGPHHAYLLRAFAPQPDFTLTLSADKFDVTSGKPANVVVNIVRTNGFTDTIDVHGRGSPRLRGGDDRQIKSVRCLRKVGDDRNPRRWLFPLLDRFRSSEDRPTARHAADRTRTDPGI